VQRRRRQGQRNLIETVLISAHQCADGSEKLANRVLCNRKPHQAIESVGKKRSHFRVRFCPMQNCCCAISTFVLYWPLNFDMKFARRTKRHRPDLHLRKDCR
jgi:hypothetical protein